MVLLVNSFESRVVDVGVDLRGLDIRMSEHFLDLAEVSASGKQMGCKTVSKGVRADIRIDVCSLGVSLDESEKHKGDLAASLFETGRLRRPDI